MVWRAYYDDLSVFSSETTANPDDLPLDGIQAVKTDSGAFSANIFGWEGDEVFVSNDTLLNVRSQRPGAILREGRTCSTRRMHEIEIAIGLWHPKNLKPDAADPDWKKDIIGWRFWTETAVFDSVGIAKADWLSHWASLPAVNVQYLRLYENWKRGNGVDDFTQSHASSFYFMATSPNGLLIAGSEATDIETRYPGAIIKTGSLLSDTKHQLIVDAATAVKVL